MRITIKIVVLVLLVNIPSASANDNHGYQLPTIFYPLSFSMDYGGALRELPGADVQKTDYENGHSIVIGNIRWKYFGDAIATISHGVNVSPWKDFVRMSTTETRKACFDEEAVNKNCRNLLGNELVRVFELARSLIEKECGKEDVYNEVGGRGVRMAKWNCMGSVISLVLAPGEEDDYWSVELTALRPGIWGQSKN